MPELARRLLARLYSLDQLLQAQGVLCFQASLRREGDGGFRDMIHAGESGHELRTGERGQNGIGWHRNDDDERDAWTLQRLEALGMGQSQGIEVAADGGRSLRGQAAGVLGRDDFGTSVHVFQ